MAKCPKCNKKIQPDYIDLQWQVSGWHKFYCPNCYIKLKVKRSIYYLWILLFRLGAFLFLWIGIYSVSQLPNFLHLPLSKFYLTALFYLFAVFFLICLIFWFFLILYWVPYRGRVYLDEGETINK